MLLDHHVSSGFNPSCGGDKEMALTQILLLTHTTSFDITSIFESSKIKGSDSSNEQSLKVRFTQCQSRY